MSRDPQHPPLLGKTSRALLVMAVALSIPYASPRLAALRVLSSRDAAEEGDPAPHSQRSSSPSEGAIASSLAPPSAGELTLPASENQATINNALPAQADGESLTDLDIDPTVRRSLRAVPIEDPGGHALDTFVSRLERTRRAEPGAVTRLLYYGDSVIASDYMSGTLRRRLQAKFGDAGHGFILISNPWQWYFHNDVAHASYGEWKASRLAGPIAPDGMYGLGGVSFASYGGDVAWFGTASRGDFGRRVGRFDIYYLEQPGGGNVETAVAGKAVDRFSTRGDAKVSRVHSVHVEDGEAKLTLRAAGGGPVRLFGVVLEREQPGIVCDALGAHAAMAVFWKRQNREHWREQLALRDPALIILQYGTNESDLWRLDRDEYERALSTLLDELKEITDASLLVAAPLDRAELRTGKLATKAVILDLVAIQRRVALSHGAAFWSTFDAMGGDGAMARWVAARPALAGSDLTHPTPLGAEVLGDLLNDALVDAFARREADAGGEARGDP